MHRQFLLTSALAAQQTFRTCFSDSLTFSWCCWGCPDWHYMSEHQSPHWGRTPSHRLLLPYGSLYFMLIRINNWKKEIDMCKLRVVTFVFNGLTLCFELPQSWLWPISRCLYVCDVLLSWLHFSHCVLVCSVDKRSPWPWLLFCCCWSLEKEQRVCFLQDRVKGKLLIERCSRLCNNLLIQKLLWAVSGSVEQVTVLLHWFIFHRLLIPLHITAGFIRKRGHSLKQHQVALFRIKHEMTYPYLS